MRIRKAPSLAGLLVLTVVPAVPLSAMAQDAPVTQVAAPPPAPPPPPASTVSRSTVALWAAGVAVVGAGAATTFGILALQNKSDYEAHPTFSNSDNGNNFAAYTDGCIALAVAAGVTSLVLYFTRDTSPDASTPKPRSASVSVAPLVTPHGGGAGAVLRF